jgi:glutaredoxin
MNITLFVTENCATCRRVENQLYNLLKNHENILLIIEDIRITRSSGIAIVPALFIGEELYSYGDLNEERFLDTLKLISKGN